MNLLERPLPRWGKQLARLPLALYRLRLGRLLGHRFLVVVHRGRRTGRLYRTGVEVVRWDSASAEATVASGWGERASWWRNLQAAPAVEVWLAGTRYRPEQRFLDLDERIEVLNGYRREHPYAAGLLGPLLGLGREASLDAAAERLPMVAFRLPLRHERYLNHEQARRVYDRIGRSQDLQAIYEHAAIRDLLAYGDFREARSVFELGYGTGALAQRLLAEHLPPGSRYVGVDLSPRMHELARRRLADFGDRAELRLGEGSLRLPCADDSFDRVVATYVLDLLPPEEIDIFLREAHRLLAPGGLLCLTSLTYGRAAPARALTRAWLTLWGLSPGLVGGCRPLRLTEHLASDLWELRHRNVVTTLALSSEVVVAASRTTAVASLPNPLERVDDCRDEREEGVSQAGEGVGGGPGDLGRRVRERRTALGLSRKEVAERAGMDAGYLEYVESDVASLPAGALLRLAAALETTASALGGGGIERPPGRARAGRRPVLEELTPEECRRLLGGGGVGRVVFLGEAGPAALPVNFALLEGDVVFRTAADGVVARVVGSEGASLAFEVDHVDDALSEGWSVLIRGHARPLHEEELARVQGLEIEPWAGGVRDLYVLLESSEVTGRHIRVG